MMKQSSWLNGLCLASLILSLTSLAVSLRHNNDAERLADETYRRIVGELADEMRPIYSDFGVKIPDKSSTVAGVIGPALRIIDSKKP